MVEHRKRQPPQTPVQRYGQFGRLLKLERERHGLTQAQLAQRIGQTQEAIAQLERSRNLPSLETALDLAAALHTTVDALMGRPAGYSVVHYHTEGEVRVWVSNGGLVVLGNYGASEIDKLLASWQRLRDQTPGPMPDPRPEMGKNGK